MVKLKKVAILLIAIGLSLYGWRLYINQNKKYFFNKQVSEGIFDKVNNLEFAQYNLGLHSPYVFQFKVAKQDRKVIDDIIRKQHLKREKRIPPIVKQTPFIVDKLGIDLYELMKKYPFYLILYQTKYDSGERILIVTDDKIIFHTTGFVDKDRLRKVGYWYDENYQLTKVSDVENTLSFNLKKFHDNLPRSTTPVVECL